MSFTKYFRFIILVLICVQEFASAAIISENWYKVLSTGVHTGFLFVRYEFLEKTQQYKVSYILSTNAAGGNVTESLQSISSKGLKPVSYQYISITAGTPKTIDAVVKKDLKSMKDKLFLTVNENNKVTNREETLSEGSIFSSALSLSLLTEGLKQGVNFKYDGIAEEDGTEAKGLAFVKSVEEYKGKKVFKVANDFKQTRFISLLSQEGIPLSTNSPYLSIETQVVNTQEEATKGMQIPTKTMSSLFGTYPSKSNIQLKEASASVQSNLNETQAVAPNVDTTNESNMNTKQSEVSSPATELPKKAKAQ